MAVSVAVSPVLSHVVVRNACQLEDPQISVIEAGNTMTSLKLSIQSIQKIFGAPCCIKFEGSPVETVLIAVATGGLSTLQRNRPTIMAQAQT